MGNDALYLTFDIGTTALKTALLADNGRLLALHIEEYTPESPRADWAQMPGETYWHAAVCGARAVLATNGVDPSAVRAIGFSSQGQSFLPLNAAGAPLYQAIVWVDTRAQEIADDWKRNGLSPDQFRRSSGYPWLLAGLTVFKIAWLARYAPEAHRAWKFLCLPDYLLFRMTGETATDRVIAHFSGLYDFRTGDWEPTLLAAAGITRDQLPTILEPGTVAGTLRPEAAAELGVPAGAPVCVGANDQLAGALGAGNVCPGIVTETTGTSLALIMTTLEPLDDTRVCVGRHAISGLYYALAFAPTSAIVMKWFRDLCAPGMSYECFLEGIEQIAPGCDGLTVLPHFNGAGTPTYAPHARGGFAGLTLGHTRLHLTRAIMESCACILQECLTPIVDQGVRINSIRSLGGAARNDAWLQMKADLLGLPVERPSCSDAASLGAAMLAAVGAGQFSSIREAADAWYRPAAVFAPDPTRHATYCEIYQRYQSLYHRLCPNSSLAEKDV